MTLSVPRRTLPGTLIAAIALCTLGVLGAGAWYYLAQRDNLLKDDQGELAAIAATKVAEVARWRAERIADARFFQQSSAFADVVRGVLREPSPARVAELDDWLRPSKDNHDYRAIFLLDLAGRVHHRLGAGLETIEPGSLPAAAGEVTMSDLEPDPGGNTRHVDVLVPLTSGGGSGEPLGTLVFRVDPTLMLYPQVHAYPTPSATGEALLLRREGNAIVYLNGSRHRPGGDIRISMPPAGALPTSRTALMAWRGEEGLVTGPDYRGREVLAAVRRVPGSPWYLVAKMDLAEVYTPVRTSLLPVTVAALALLAILYGTVTVHWHQEKLRWQLRETRKEKETQARQQRVYEVLAGIGKAIQRTGDPPALLAEACRILVETGRLRMAWAGLAGPTAGTLRLAGSYGDRGYLAALGVGPDGALPAGPAATALATGRHAICNDLAAEAATPWARLAGEHGYGAMASLPLLVAGEPRGVLSLCSSDPGFFDAEENRLLDELAANLSLALQFLEEETRRKQAEAALRHSEAELRLRGRALEAADNGVILTTADGTILWCNPAVTALTGYGPGELVGGKPSVLKSGQHDAGFYRQMWHTVLGGAVWRGELVNRRKDGSLYHEEMTVTPVANESGAITHMVAVKQDVSERKRAEELLQETNRRLTRALDELKEAEQRVIRQERLRALGEMASGIAHDFNNALGAIVGYSELILSQPADGLDPAKTLRYTQLINTSALDAGETVNRLRAFYRRREEGLAVAAVRLDLLAAETVSLTQPKWQSDARARGAHIQVLSDLQQVPAILGDPAELRQALTNLVFNAVDAMPRGGVLTLRTLVRDQTVLIEVSDSGIGMDEEVLRRCLDPFFTTKGERGTGLGLSVVYGVVQRHDGRIDIRSTPAAGSTVTLCFPVASGGAEARPAQDGAAAQSRLRILVIDDEPTLREVIGDLLRVDGHQVVTASGGKPGLEQLRRGAFDLTIVDRSMPGMDGCAVAAAIRADWPGVRVIMLTGFGAMMEAAGECPPGVDLVLSKPTTLKALRQAVARVLEMQPGPPIRA